MEHCNPSVRSGNYQKTIESMLGKMPRNDSRMIYSHDKFNFNCEVFNGGAFCIICMCDANFSAGVTFNFITDVKSQWNEMYNKNGGSGGDQSISQSNIKSFKSILQKRMHYFNTDPSANKIKRLKNEIADVKEKMVDNIDKTLLRGEKIEMLVDKTSELKETSSNFRHKGKALKRGMILKWIVTIGLIVLLLLGVGTGLFFYFCGGISCIQSLRRNRGGGGSG